MEEATTFSDELRKMIEAEQAIVTELMDQNSRAQRLMKLNDDEVEAIFSYLNQSQARSTKRERWINLVVALVSLTAGYVLDQIKPEVFVDLVRG